MSDYLRPHRLTEALAALGAGPVCVLAGGTDLFPATPSQRLEGPVLDLTAIDEMRGIVSAAGGVRIGACTRWADVAAAGLPPALAALAQAAREVGGRQVQAAGTVGGNLCNASPAADGVPPLLVCDAEVELAASDGLRRLPLDRFVTGPRRTARQAGEILTAIHLPAASLAGRSLFLKLGARRHLVISIASVAARIVEREGLVAEAAFAVGACSAVPCRLPAVEQALAGAPLAAAPDLVRMADVAGALAPLDDIRASAEYRAEAAFVLVRRAVAALTGGAA